MDRGSLNDTVARFGRHEATVGILGLGYVGLPLVLTFARKGFNVIGFDIDPKKVEMLARGNSYIRHISGDAIAAVSADGHFSPTTDFSRSAECDALLLCVPTPLNRNREPDLSFVESTAREIGPHLRRGQLVILESTTYPGTTEGPLLQILEECSGMTAGRDFHLAYSPEREDPGNPNFDTQRIPKVVGGLTGPCTDLAVALYRGALDAVVPVSTTRVAEMTKLLENIFRSVNIALVNELKILGDRMGIDVWEVIAAAATKPFGFMPFYPGPGLGGHCIPIDPFYLTWKAREYEMTTRFIELAGEVNVGMPRYVIDKTAEALNNRGKAVKDANVLILGIAYKRDVDDVRESPALRIIELLRERGAVVSYHDPYVPTTPPMRNYDIELSSVPLTDATVAGADAVMIITDHGDIDYERVVLHAELVIDTRNATAAVAAGREKIVKA